MLLTPVTKEIDGIKFTVTQFPAMRALIIKARLAKVVAPGLAELLTVFGGNLSNTKVSDLDAGALAPAFGALAEKLDPAEFASLVLTLFGTTVAVIEGSRHDINSEEKLDYIFTGRLEVIYKALYLVLQVNDFFGLGGIGKALSRKTPEANPPADTSTKS